MTRVMIPISLYMIRNRNGEWLRSVGQNGYGKSWVKEANDAKVWTKLGQARSRITWWAKTYPDFGIPELIEIAGMVGTVVDETDRVNKALIAIQRSDITNKIRSVKWDLQRLLGNRKPQEQRAEQLQLRIQELEQQRKAIK